MNNLCHQEDSEFNANKNKSFSRQKDASQVKAKQFLLMYCLQFIKILKPYLFMLALPQFKTVCMQ